MVLASSVGPMLPPPPHNWDWALEMHPLCLARIGLQVPMLALRAMAQRAPKRSMESPAGQMKWNCGWGLSTLAMNHLNSNIKYYII